MTTASRVAEPATGFIARLEQAAELCWPPETIVEIDGWRLRGSGDVSNRTNACTVHHYAGDNLDRSIDAVERWYGSRDRRACFQLNPLRQPAGLDERLAERGYAMITPAHMMARRLEGPGDPEPVGIVLEMRPTGLVMNALSDPRGDKAGRAARAALFNRLERPSVFAVAMDSGIPAGGGLCALDGAFAVISAMWIQVPYRGRGYAASVLTRLLQWASAMRAHHACLQVEHANLPALRLYERAGFRPQYDYWYRRAEPAA